MTESKKEPASRTGVTGVSDSALHDFLGYHLKRASSLVQADLARTLKPFGLRVLTFSALVLIVENPGLRQSQLADVMKIERPNLVVLIDELENRELIFRERVPNDRRAYALKATIAGRKLCEQAVAADKAHEDFLFQDLDEDMRGVLVAALKLVRNRAERGKV